MQSEEISNGFKNKGARAQCNIGRNAHSVQGDTRCSFSVPFHSKKLEEEIIEDCNRRKCVPVIFFIEMKCTLVRFSGYVIGSSLAQFIKIENTRISI